MYYRLKEPWTFRGWKKMPYALRAEYGEKKHERPLFMEKEPFMALLYCNGEEAVDLSEFDEKIQQVFKELLGNDMLEQSEEPMRPLESWQRYIVYPSRFVESVHWSINCRHCLVSAPDAHHPQLPLSDCLHIIDEIARCGIRRVDITGGEPLVRSDFEEIVKALSERGIDIGVVFTNASLLTRDIIEMLKKYHQHPSFQLSFDGLGHHDWLRGVPGAEKQADEALRLLKEYEIPVNVAMCIHKGNRDSLRDTANYLAGLGVKSLRVNSPQKLGVWKQYSEEYSLTEDEVWETYRKYIGDYFADGMPTDIELDGYFSCKKGKTDYSVHYAKKPNEKLTWDKCPYCESVRYNTYIGAEGRLAPCMGFSDTALRDKFPSVLEEHLGTLTLSGFCHDIVETKVSDLIAKNPECEKCEHLSSCLGGCMVESMSDDGDYLIPDQRCCYFHKHIGEAAVRAAADEAIKKYCPQT